MGHKNTKLSKKNVKKIMRETRFTKKEVLDWYRCFLLDCPTGKLSRSELVKIYDALFPNGDHSTFTEAVFRACDINNDEHICFYEFITTMSVMARGTLNERLQWVCQIFDTDCDGTISRDELEELIFTIVAITGGKVCRETACERAEAIWIKRADDEIDGIPVTVLTKIIMSARKTLIQSE
ncbi:Oidioi.mRNA.OKI2018_I69.XSR.g15345.t1.cds [Oikopleura dioica]|uniref:Oidioi.mRNA.OKI2018_I69.XSR.g15345.t1.cds n=1 Tax=Oikopleura dioica TaxID=34765 RepID=A0ABN7SHQ2_OIKDI|nr:Oidioi.mRNA.OKI2018_I69.XSR.g15345.t1.cds [Oikopleura dioica]